MHRLVAARAPAGALAQARGVIHRTDINRAVLDLLEMALETQRRIAFRQHLDVHAAVRNMAGGATFAHRFVLEHVNALLRRVTLRAVFLLRQELRAAAGVGDALVRRMTLHAGHPAFGHGMMTGQAELAAHIRMTLKAERFCLASGTHPLASTEA